MGDGRQGSDPTVILDPSLVSQAVGATYRSGLSLSRPIRATVDPSWGKGD